MPEWLKSVKGVLLDVTGVLYNSGKGDGVAISGSIDALNRLQSSHLQVRFVSNECSGTTNDFAEKLRRLGFCVDSSQISTPAPTAAKFFQQHGLRPHLLIRERVLSEFDNVDQSNPNCVCVGDAEHDFTYDNMNACFQQLMKMKSPRLFTLGYGKYFLETDGLKLDVGAYAKALEYACDLTAEVIGKPSAAFFQTAIDSMSLKNDDVVMIGDDIVGDVSGAQKCGIRALQVRTGKFRAEWERHPTITPDLIVNDLAHAVKLMLD